MVAQRLEIEVILIAPIFLRKSDTIDCKNQNRSQVLGNEVYDEK